MGGLLSWWPTEHLLPQPSVRVFRYLFAKPTTSFPPLPLTQFLPLRQRRCFPWCRWSVLAAESSLCQASRSESLPSPSPYTLATDDNIILLIGSTEVQRQFCVATSLDFLVSPRSVCHIGQHHGVVTPFDGIWLYSGPTKGERCSISSDLAFHTPGSWSQESMRHLIIPGGQSR